MISEEDIIGPCKLEFISHTGGIGSLYLLIKLLTSNLNRYYAAKGRIRVFLYLWNYLFLHPVEQIMLSHLSSQCEFFLYLVTGIKVNIEIVPFLKREVNT